MADAAGGEGEPAPAFKKPAFKKKGAAKPAGLRKRPRPGGGGDGSSGSDDGGGGVAVVEKKKKAAVNSFSTGQRRRAAGGGDASDNDDAAPAVFKSTRDAMPVKTRGGATDHVETETSTDRDARAILERSIALQADADAEGADGAKTYKGQAGYKQHIATSAAAVGANKHTGLHGPIRAPQYARTTAVFDYQPDICKDYKETGYCGFGDSCKFLHDRGDYKAGWQLEREWEDKQKKRRQAMEAALDSWGGGDDGGGGGGAENDSDNDEKYAVAEDDDLPFACFICREGFRDPVVTTCGHYFCEKCALDHYRQSMRCAACGKQTGGVFNYAKRLVDALAKKGLVKTVGGGGGAAEEGGEDEFAVREEVELTAQTVKKVNQGGWHTVTD